MKSKLILTCAMVAISLCLFACTLAPKQVSVEASCDDFMKLAPVCAISKEIEVPVGGSLTVILCSNPTTGFQWESARISDQTVLQQVDHEFEAPEYTGNRSPPPGTPGKEVWTFKALKEGKSTISMEYSQPWGGGTKAAWKFVLTVVVKQGATETAEYSCYLQDNKNLDC